MCGIAGVLVFNGEPVTASIIHSMTNSLSHRGPNDSGCVLFTEKNPVSFKELNPICSSDSGVAALGHRRLSILDVSLLGHQPMSTPDGKVWLVLNGEIYNYVELREELERMGYVFRSRTDTEVLLYSYVAWGTACFRKFNGMWALAIYDLRSHSLLLSRDRLGKKPLYYYQDGKRLVFGSEPKALFQCPYVVKRPDLSKVGNYAGRHYRYVDDTNTSFFEGVSQVPKSSILSFDVTGKDRLEVYWSLKPEGDLTLKYSEVEIVGKFRDLLDDAVRLRLRSDVPVGALLSGGMDSTSIVSLAGRRHANFKTFSSVPGEGRYDESRFIREVVEKAGVDATFIYPKPANLMKTLQEMLTFHDEPVCTPTWYSMYLMVKEMAKANVPVVLTGHAGDELLAGYWDHYHYFFYDLRHFGGSDAAEHQAWLLNHGRDPGEYDRERAYVEAWAAGKAFQLDRFSKYLDCLKAGVRDLVGTPVYHAPFLGALDRRLYLELLYEGVPVSLRAEDRNCMAFAIENRVPFLDYRLIEFAFSLPLNCKMRGGLGKWILREAMKGILPEAVRTRKDKAGHVLPFDEWLRGEHRDDVEQFMNQDSFINREIYDINKVREKFNEHLKGQNHYMFFWQYLNLHIWYEQQFGG